MTDQDWTEVVLHKKSQKGKPVDPEKQARDALQTGQQVETFKKFEGGANKQKGGVGQRGRALDAVGTDEQEGAVHHKQLSHDVCVRIQQGRQAKGWTQKQLAQAIAEKVQLVNEYEAGKAIPSPQALSKMERALGVKLRGKV